jgi:hypothetical protein
MTPDQLVAAYPRLYHMAEDGSWPSIRRHGLLSTEALLERFDVAPAAKEQILGERRGESVTLRHEVWGTAVVRDQLPMLESQLSRALSDGLLPGDWYRLLNRHVFFWVREERLVRLLNARAYRDRPHLVLEFDTADIVARHSDGVRLTPMNTGNTRPRAFPRGRDTFLPISQYPFEDRRRRAGRDAIVELAVEVGVPDAGDLTRRISRWQGGLCLQVIERHPDADGDAATSGGG